MLIMRVLKQRSFFLALFLAGLVQQLRLRNTLPFQPFHHNSASSSRLLYSARASVQSYRCDETEGRLFSPPPHCVLSTEEPVWLMSQTPPGNRRLINAKEEKRGDERDHREGEKGTVSSRTLSRVLFRKLLRNASAKANGAFTCFMDSPI